MLAISVRVSPCRDLARRSSLGRLTAMVPSSWATVIGGATVWIRVPLGPLTVTRRSSSATSTPAGTGMGSLPMRDMLLFAPSSSVGPGSPDVGQHFAAHALLVRLSVGEEPLARRDDRDAEAAEDLGEAVVLGVDPEAGLADAADAGDRALAVRAVLQGDRQLLAHGALGGLRDLVAADVALLLEDVGHPGLELAVGHGHLVVVGLGGVAQPREHVCDRVGHRHGTSVLSRRGFPRVRDLQRGGVGLE